MKAIRTEQDLTAWIMDRVARAMRIPQPELEKETSARTPWTRKEVRRTIRDLVEKGSLMYTYELGTSFLEECYTGPSRLGERIVAVPPLMKFDAGEQDVPVVMKQGASFGSGRHPTTRMALRAIEKVMAPQNSLRPRGHALDVGTGTGILALAALKLGMEKAFCTDLDPCALFETRENALLNGLENQIQTGDVPIPEIPGRYSLLLANLRLPTLLEALPVFDRLLSRPGYMIVSGIQVSETREMAQAALEYGFAAQELASEQKWACMIFLQNNHKELTNGEL